ncbi:hypothetical protein KC19_5G107400 [Ceratodon purpureus]|uniref:Uncharacterized protein n=1 Tax=Ceratodon purpureus TaxID=3225 RepID=A0A8T0I037_CERPU|nr:hypothetical protein KC19_5G107400 [Ceratodon purpureus]
MLRSRNGSTESRSSVHNRRRALHSTCYADGNETYLMSTISTPITLMTSTTTTLRRRRRYQYQLHTTSLYTIFKLTMDHNSPHIQLDPRHEIESPEKTRFSHQKFSANT